ncbi:hypothetical protein ACFVVU_35755 [Kitasatospora sp. NPDC057965]|uniref:hypothetical protein n=1 Tax=Kitasatospora sp. NPDC057965 TaxID=3346291 RepID=UPI0036DBD2B2
MADQAAAPHHLPKQSYTGLKRFGSNLVNGVRAMLLGIARKIIGEDTRQRIK